MTAKLTSRDLFATAIAIPGISCIGLGASGLIAAFIPFYASISLFFVGIALIYVAIKVAPPSIRLSHGAPMVESDKEIVVNPTERDDA